MQYEYTKRYRERHPGKINEIYKRWVEKLDPERRFLITSKFCSNCKQMKTIDHFNKSRYTKDGWEWRCKECTIKYHTEYSKTEHARILQRANARRYRARHPDRIKGYVSRWYAKLSSEEKYLYHRRNHLKIRFGLTIQAYEEMLASQQYHCAICGKFMHKPYVDHEHRTGRVRGILCHNCNLAIGYIKDDPETARKLMEYLRPPITVEAERQRLTR